MKKLISVVLSTMVVCSAFAEAYSDSKAKQLAKKKDFKGLIQYCRNAQVSSESDYIHMYHFCMVDFKKTMTAEEILKSVQKFKNIKSYEYCLGNVYAQHGLINEAQQQYEKTKYHTIIEILANKLAYKKQDKKALQIAKKYNLNSTCCLISLKMKDYDNVWKYGKAALLQVGGLNNIDKANKILVNMFRYKPASVTKEQQIEFLSKLAQMYPIPGTDFAKWKGFMGFVGFKYKALTGKDLF